MSRVASPQLEARLQASATTLARLWRVTRPDGTVLRFTDAVLPVSIEIDPDVGEQVYRSDVSFTCSAIFTCSSLVSAQSVQMTFVMSDDGFNEGQLRQRLFDGSLAEIFIVDYSFPEYGVVQVFSGQFGQIKVSNLPIAAVEISPAQGKFSGKAIGTEVYSETCRASLGDSRCKIDLPALTIPFTVGSASGTSVVAAALNQANHYWDLGYIKWLTGNNAGTTSKVVVSNQGSTSVFLNSPPFYAIQPGDTGEISPGCDKYRVTCLKKFNNVNNGRFEPDVPDGAAIPGSNYRTAKTGWIL